MSESDRVFQLTAGGVFMQRRGAAWNEQKHRCEKKLCFVATDQAFLADIRSVLADRPDCFFVKYSVRPRDGMYLGRCFLMDEKEVGVVWAKYKLHPRLFCSVQDDDFTLPFRSLT